MAVLQHLPSLAYCLWLNQVNPFEPETDYFTRDPQIHPIKAAPRPKAGFIPSKSEAKQYAPRLFMPHPFLQAGHPTQLGL